MSKRVSLLGKFHVFEGDRNIGKDAESGPASAGTQSS